MEGEEHFTLWSIAQSPTRSSPPAPSSRMAHRREKPPAPHERRVLQLALLAGLPGIVVSLALLWRDDHSAKVQWTLGLFVVGAWLITAYVLRERIVRPLQTLSNMLAALREGDYSIRARGAEREDEIGRASCRERV